MEGGARLRRECSAEKKATSFLRFLTRIFLADGFYRSIEAGEKPVAHQRSIGGRRRARPQFSDLQPSPRLRLGKLTSDF